MERGGGDSGAREGEGGGGGGGLGGRRRGCSAGTGWAQLKKDLHRACWNARVLTTGRRGLRMEGREELGWALRVHGTDWKTMVGAERRGVE